MLSTMSKRCRSTGLAALMVLVAGCSSHSAGPAAQATAPVAAPTSSFRLPAFAPPTASTTSTAQSAKLLAAADGAHDDAPYVAALDATEPICSEAPGQLADTIITARAALAKNGLVGDSALAQLRSLVADAPKGGPRTDCSSGLAADLLSHEMPSPTG